MSDQARVSAPTPDIEFWFDFASNYSYPSVMRIEGEAQRHRVLIRWKPFLLGPIFRVLGMENSPFVLQKEKGRYVWLDMIRQCRRYGIQWVQPSVFPRLSVVAARVALLGAEEPWVASFSRRVMELNFAEDQDINHPERLAELLTEFGLPGRDIVNEAQSESIKTRLREQTEAARRRGIFGAPTFFVGSEMFWGNDRLDEALAFAAGNDVAQARLPLMDS